jgi:hypothetical protein
MFLPSVVAVALMVLPSLAFSQSDPDVSGYTVQEMIALATAWLSFCIGWVVGK